MFEFNEWSSPLLPGFIQGIVFAVILTLRGLREERISDYFAALLLVFGSLYIAQWMLGFAGWYDAHDWRTTLMFYMEWKNVYAFGPLIWLYFRSLTNTDFRWSYRYWLHFVPLFIVLLEPVGIFLYDWVYWRLLAGNDFTYFHHTRGPAAEWDNNGGLGSLYFYFYAALSFVHLLYYLFRTLKDYRAYRRYLQGEFSNAEQLTFSSLRYTLYAMTAGVVLTFILEGVNVAFSETYVDSWDSYFVMSLFTFFAAVQFMAIDPNRTRALRFEPDAASNDPVVSEPAARAAVTSAPDPELARWEAALERRLAKHDDFLNPDLKLGDLAAAIGTNSSVLSKVINGRFGKNFNDFVNGLRCDAFNDRIRAGAHHRHTLLSIAMDCGFNSKSTFNRAYRKCTDLSPGEMVKRIDVEREALKGAGAAGN